MSRKFLAVVEINRIRFLKLKKAERPLVSIFGRMYPNDDDLYVKDRFSGDAVRFQRIDSSQIIHCRRIFIDPNMTRAKAKSMNQAGTKRKLWLNMDSSQIWKWLTAIAVVGSLIYGFLVMG